MLSGRSVVILSQSRSVPFRLLSVTSTARELARSGQAAFTIHSDHFDVHHKYPGTVPVYRTRTLLTNRCNRSIEYHSRITGSSDLNTFVPQRSLHTSSHHFLPAEEASVHLHGDAEGSTQGIQGDDCINFKLWMESCRRYGLENCDQQLQGIQTGRKTLAQVLTEQDELIRTISQKYREEAETLNQSECSVQGPQADWSVFPSVNAPCPQGVQGDDCVRFKLWLENCHRFGFNECMDQLQTLSSGRKSLGQVFAEQDQLIRSVVNNHRQTRSYSTSASSDKPESQVGSSEKEVKLSQKEQLKRAVKEYGSTVIVFHIGISLISLGGFYLAVSSGIDVVGILKSLGVGASILESKAVAGAGTFVVAYAVHKVFAPARIAITLTSTPFIVRHLRKIGFLKPPKVKPDTPAK